MVGGGRNGDSQPDDDRLGCELGVIVGGDRSLGVASGIVAGRAQVINQRLNESLGKHSMRCEGMSMMKAVRTWWRAIGPRVHVAMGLWVLHRRLDLIEWRFRLEALL